MNEHQVLKLISCTGEGEKPLNCDELTRLYVRTLADLSERLMHDDLMELLAFGSLLYTKAFQEYRTAEKPTLLGSAAFTTECEKPL